MYSIGGEGVGEWDVKRGAKERNVGQEGCECQERMTKRSRLTRREAFFFNLPEVAGVVSSFFIPTATSLEESVLWTEDCSALL